MKRVKVIVVGRVQGVGFRYFVKEQAERNGVNGFVRNLPDGKVEIDAEAEYSTLNYFLRSCKRGSGLSEVDDFITQNVPVYGFSNFRIKL